MDDFYVYIVTNPRKTVLYTGTTNDLETRLIQHYQNRGNQKTFAGKYYCYNLIYYETFPTPLEAIAAEKFIKGKSRSKKMDIIRSKNPSFEVLNKQILGYWPPKFGI